MSVIDRRQRWAALSVRAHVDQAALAVDLLLYDRLVIPVPADEDEVERWTGAGWNPDSIAMRWVQAGGLIHTVPWNIELRDEWADRQRQLRELGSQVAYGATAGVLTRSERAWAEIMAGLQPDEISERKPFLIAAYQSREEAIDGLVATAVMSSASSAGGTRPVRLPDSMPGARDVDHVAALVVRKILEEPALTDPEEAFVAATELAAKPDFQRARRALFDFEDDLYNDEWDQENVESKITGLEEEYNEVVRNFVHATRRRRVATILPKVAGWGAVATGHPHAKGPVEKSLGIVVGKFVSLENPMNPQEHPGAAFAMIRAAYRERFPEPEDRSDG